MTYEIVRLSAKTIVGLQARTSHADPAAGRLSAACGGGCMPVFTRRSPASLMGKASACIPVMPVTPMTLLSAARRPMERSSRPGAVQAVSQPVVYAKFIVHGDVQEGCGGFLGKPPALGASRALSRRILRNISPAATCSTRKSTSMLP